MSGSGLVARLTRRRELHLRMAYKSQGAGAWVSYSISTSSLPLPRLMLQLADVETAVRQNKLFTALKQGSEALKQLQKVGGGWVRTRQAGCPGCGRASRHSENTMKLACPGGRFICCTTVGSTGMPIQSCSLPPPGTDHLPEGCLVHPSTMPPARRPAGGKRGGRGAADGGHRGGQGVRGPHPAAAGWVRVG